MKPVIATIGSHSSLQILKGAKDEGFKTLVVCKKNMEAVYKSFRVADEVLIVEDFKEVLDMKFKDTIFIPHGSFVEYIGYKNINNSELKIFGNKKIFDWEADKEKTNLWLKKAKIKTPKLFENPSEIDRLCIVKFHGAKGGKGYFLVRNENEFYEKIEKSKFKKEKHIIQEYVVGTRFYPHYFYSKILKELEFFGLDIRYESNVDGISRLPPEVSGNIEPSYVIVGNMPVVIRESLLPEIFEMGQNVITTSEELFDGISGPFCIEIISTEDLNFYAIEISARIVAGTNLYIEGSPYTMLKYNEPMSTGRRIAREINLALERNMMDKIIT